MKKALLPILACLGAITVVSVSAKVANPDTAKVIPYPEVLNLKRVPTFNAYGMVPQVLVAKHSSPKSPAKSGHAPVNIAKTSSSQPPVKVVQTPASVAKNSLPQGWLKAIATPVKISPNNFPQPVAAPVTLVKTRSIEPAITVISTPVRMARNSSQQQDFSKMSELLLESEAPAIARDKSIRH